MTEKRKRGVVVSVRFTIEEFELLAALAERQGTFVSTIIRERALMRPAPLQPTRSQNVGAKFGINATWSPEGTSVSYTGTQTWPAPNVQYVAPPAPSPLGEDHA